MKAKLGDVYCTILKKYDKWCCFQVVEEGKDRIALLALNWFQKKIPSAKDLNQMKPLYINHHSWNEKMEVFYTEQIHVPDTYTCAGNIPSLYDGKISTHGGWDDFLRIESQYEWMQLPEEKRKQYKEAQASPKNVFINGHEYSTKYTNIHEDILENFSNWHELDQLPALYEIHYNGNDKGIIDYINTNQMITYLNWINHGQTIIDLSRSHLKKLVVATDGLKKIIINDALEFLSLVCDSLVDMQVILNNKGKNLELWLFNLNDAAMPVFDLPDLHILSFAGVAQVDAEKIASAYPDIRKLNIQGNPGYISNIHALYELKNLQHLSMKDIFGFTSTEFPTQEQMPSLKVLDLNSIPAEAAKELKKMYRGIASLSITQPRSDEWLAVNANNPFRCWDDLEGMPKKHAKAAFNAYKKIIADLTHGDKSKASIKKVLKAFVGTFNEINESHILDTIEREDIYNVYCNLLEKFKLDAIGSEWFDEWRDF